MKHQAQSSQRKFQPWSVLFAGALLSACSTPPHSTSLPAPDIEGSYTDNYNTSQDIMATKWIMGGKSEFDYRFVNNPQSYLTAKNSSANPYYPDQYSRFEWTYYLGDLWYCQQVYDAGSAADANNFNKYPKADNSNPTTGGCGLNGYNFPWSKLIPN